VLIITEKSKEEKKKDLVQPAWKEKAASIPLRLQPQATLPA
jgi:hypothetical protein